MDRITAAEVFICIVDRGSLAAAAESLGMSRAMVTRYLAEMEQWAGARLLHRTTRRLSLTHAGEQTLARCRQLLAVAEGVTEVLNTEAAPVQGLVRLACAQSLAQEVLAPAVVHFLRQHPLAAIDLHIDSRAVNLVEERIDLAVRITNNLDPNLIARQLGDCPSVVCAAPDYLVRRGTPVRPEDLAEHNCLTYSWFGSSLWTFTNTEGEPFSVPVTGNLSANESQVLLAAAVQGGGITQQPLYAVSNLLANGQLVALLPGYQPMRMGIHAVFQSRRQMTPVLRALIDFLVDWFERQARSGS